MNLRFIVSLVLININVFSMNIIEKRDDILKNGYNPEKHGAPLKFATLFVPSHYSPKEDWEKYFGLFNKELVDFEKNLRSYRNFCCPSKRISFPVISKPKIRWPSDEKQNEILLLVKNQHDSYRLIQAMLGDIRNELIKSSTKN